MVIDNIHSMFGQVIAFAERDQEDRLDPMIYIFPRMTKCTFHKFGTSGEPAFLASKFLLYLDFVAPFTFALKSEYEYD